MRTTVKATAAAVLLLLALAAAPAGAANQGTDRLLNAYPLEQRPATVAGAPARGPTAASAPRSGGADSPRLTQGAALAVAAGTMLLAGFLVTRRRPRARPALAAAPAAADPPAPAMEPALAAGSLAPAAIARTASAAAPPAEPAEHPAPTEPARPARAAAAAAATLERPEAVRAAPAMPVQRPRDGVHCQIRWMEDGDASRFAAVTTKGRERATIAVSPAFAWDGPEPPAQAAEPHAALHTLVEELLATGWQPVRGRGREHGAPRWYARRFLLAPHESEPSPPDEPMDAPEGGLA